MPSLTTEVVYLSERISEMENLRSTSTHVNGKGVNTISNPSTSLEKEKSTSSVSKLGRDAIKKMHDKGNRGSTYCQLQSIINERTKHNLVEGEKRRCSRYRNR